MTPQEKHQETMRVADSIMEDLEQAQRNYMGVQIEMENIVDWESDTPFGAQVSDLFLKLRKATDEVLETTQAMWRMYYDRQTDE